MSGLVAGFNNDTIEISVASKDYQRVNFTIISKDLIKGQILLKLIFKDISSISVSNVRSFFKFIRFLMRSR